MGTTLSPDRCTRRTGVLPSIQRVSMDGQLRTISFTHLLPTARAVLDRILGLHFHLLANRDAVVAAVIAPGLPDRAQLGVVLLEDSLLIAAHTAGGLGVGALLFAEKAYRHFKQRMHFLYGVYERRRREGVTGSINHLLLFLSVPIGVRKGGGRPERFLSLRVEQVVGRTVLRQAGIQIC
jgi:hypothetical protein